MTETENTYQILHGFADYGAEAEALSVYGSVTRATIEPKTNSYSDVVRADLSRVNDLPFPEDTFNLALLHPPCTAYSDMPSANKDGDAIDLIPEARQLGQKYAKEYIIENKPAAPLDNPVVLDGRMFGLPIKYARAFETSFRMDQPPRTARLGESAETSPFFSSERSTVWWRTAKGGLAGDYPKEHIVKNSLPLPYVHHLVRAWLDATADSEGVRDYSDYDEEMDKRRAREENRQLTSFLEDDVE